MGSIRVSLQAGLLNQSSAQVIDGSLKFNGTSNYLTRNFSAGNRKTWTWAAWVKRYKFGATNYGLFSYYPGSGNGGFLRFSDDDGGDTFRFYDTTNSLSIVSKEKFRDTEWYHIVIAVDTTQGTNTDRVKRYVNGVRQLVNASNTWPSLNDDLDINNTGNHYIGRVQASAYGPVAMSQVTFIDGQQLGPENFGFTDPLTNTWRPKKYTGTYTGKNFGNWLSMATGTPFNSDTVLANAFNGNGDNQAAPGQGNTMSFTPSPAITGISKIRLKIRRDAGQSDVNNLTLNGTAIGGSFTAGQASTVEFTTLGGSAITQLTNLSWSAMSSSNEWFGVYMIEIFYDGAYHTLTAGGVNSFYLPMDNDDFNIDKSGNGNNWTKQNFSGTFNDPDILKDSPSGAVSGGRAQTGITTTSSAPSNYATLNPLSFPYSASGDTRISTVSNGNLTYDGVTSYWGPAFSTIPLGTSGKYYFETIPASGSNVIIGVGKYLSTPGNRFWDQGTGTQTFYYSGGGNIGSNGSTLDSNPGGFSASDVIGFAMDCDGNIGKFYKNGVLQATVSMPAAVITAKDAGTVFPFCDTYNGTDVEWNFGQKPFKFPPPQGFLPLNSASATPETVITRSGQYVGVTTYTGTTGGGTIKDENILFTPDLVWAKRRNASEDHKLYDTVRGESGGNFYNIESNTTATSTTESGAITSMIRGGFTSTGGGHINSDGQPFVAWMWRAGGNKNTFNVDDVGYASAAAAGLDGGNINPTGASVGTKQGFSILKFAGTSSAEKRLTTGLNQEVEFYIMKGLSNSSDSWIVGGNSKIGFSNGEYLRLNTTAAKGSTAATDIGIPSDKSQVFVNVRNYDGQETIVYCWHSVPGLQKFGTYEGSGSAGNYVHLGFRPALIWIKNVDSTAIDNWGIIDSTRSYANVGNHTLATNLAAAESGFGDGKSVGGDYNKIDLLSDGFRLQETSGFGNTSGITFLYCAWAEASASNLYGGQSNAR